MIKIVADKDIPFVEHYFANHADLVLKSGRTITHDDVRDAEILLVRSVTKVNENLLANTAVKWVGSVTTGEDHLDTAWLDQQKIGWSTSAGFNATAVAEYVIACVAVLQQKKLLATHFKAGVVGAGKIGQQVANKLTLLDCEVVLCDPLRAEMETNFSSSSLKELTDLDFISLHTPLTYKIHATHHMINQQFLERQKQGAVLLNAGRGEVISPEDLQLSGHHLHWCFDVWAHEPIIDKTILAKAELATPHIAGYSF